MASRSSDEAAACASVCALDPPLRSKVAPAALPGTLVRYMTVYIVYKAVQTPRIRVGPRKVCQTSKLHIEGENEGHTRSCMPVVCILDVNVTKNSLNMLSQGPKVVARWFCLSKPSYISIYIWDHNAPAGHSHLRI